MSLRVLHVLNGVDPRLGGPPVAARNMVVAISRAGIEVELLACDAGGHDGVAELAADLRAALVTLRVFPLTGRAEPLVRWGVSLPMLSYLWRRVPHFDVVHVHGAWSLTSLAAVLRACSARTPTVLTPHETLTSFDIEISRSRWRTRQKRIVAAAWMRLVGLVAFSSELERLDSGVAHAARSCVIAHPVFDEEQSRPPAPPAPRDSLVVGFLGRLHSKKNLRALLTALVQCEGVELVVAGSGPEEAACREWASALGLQGRVTWLGFVAGEAKTAFLRRIHVLAMPSLYECFGVSAVEAMASGIPVVVSSTVGVADTVSRRGAGIVTGHDPHSLASAIAGLRDNPSLLSRYRSGAAGAAQAEFSFGKFGREIAHVYSDLAR